MRKTAIALLAALLLTACAAAPDPAAPGGAAPQPDKPSASSPVVPAYREDGELPQIAPGETAVGKCAYVDANGDAAVVPDGFTVSSVDGEQTIAAGLVVVGPDGSEFVWIPTTVSPSESGISAVTFSAETSPAIRTKRSFRRIGK